MLMSSAVLAQSTTTGSGKPDESHFYVGVGAGMSNLKNTKFDDVVTYSKFDTKDTLYKIFGGYQINKLLAAEFSYNNLGSSNQAGEADFGEGPFTVNSFKNKSSAWVLAAKLSPLPDAFVSPFVKLGVSRITNKQDISITAGDQSESLSAKKTATKAYYSLGAEYRFNSDLSITLEYEKFGRVGDDFGDDNTPNLIKPYGISVSLIKRF